MAAVDVNKTNGQVALEIYNFWQHVLPFAACYSEFLLHTLKAYKISSSHNGPQTPYKNIVTSACDYFLIS